MYLWTNGTEHIIASGRGIARIGGRDRIHRILGGGGAKRQEPVLEFFAVGATRVLFGRNKETFALALESFEVEPIALELVRAMVALADGRFIAAVGRKGTDGKARTSLVAMDEAGVIAGKPITLAKAKRITWPGGVWAKGAVPWPDEDPDPDEDSPFEPNELDVEAPKLKSAAPKPGLAWHGQVRLHLGPFGLVVTSSYSGLVGVFDPVTLAPRFAIRVPTDEEVEIRATATAQGVLVTVGLEGGEGTVLHVAPDATVIAHRSKFGRDLANDLGAHVLLSKDVVLVSNDAHVYQLRLPDLEATKAKGIDEDMHLFASASAGDQHVMLFGDPLMPPHTWELMSAIAGATPKFAVLPMPDFREPVAPEPPPGPERVRGAPLLAVLARPGNWTGAPGGDVAFQLAITSTGAAVTGIYFELGGPAIDGKLVKPGEVTLGDATGEFVQRGNVWRAELPALAFEAGFARIERKSKTDPPPPPNPSREASIRLAALIAGSGLLMVRVGPIGATGTAGSGMQGRSVIVGQP